MAANQGDILSMRLGDIKDVPPLPVGTYEATITSIPKIDNFGQDQKPGVEFSFKLTSPQDDVDAEALAEAGGIPEAQRENVAGIGRSHSDSTFLFELTISLRFASLRWLRDSFRRRCIDRITWHCRLEEGR